MKIQELPVNVQEQLAKQRTELINKCRNTPYEVLFYNREGSRYFEARRKQLCWSDNKGHYMPYGGGSYWIIRYGAVQWHGRRDPIGEMYYYLVNGKTYVKSQNGTEIPYSVATKKEVLQIARSIGIFDI